MFTVLRIDERQNEGLFCKILRRLPINSLRLSHSGSGDIRISYLDYVSRNGRVNFKRLERTLRRIGTPVVYSSKREIPANVSIKPFVPLELRQRLCSNMAIEVLSIMKDVPKNLRVGIYDPSGDFADLAPFILKYTDNLCVFTRNLKLYGGVSENLLHEMGALLRFSRNVSSLSDCSFIISPCTIKDRFTPKAQAVILTSAKPKVYLPCAVYYKYSFRLQKQWQVLCSEDVDSEVFGGALYSLCGVYQIGSVVPFVCANSENSHTTLSLKKYLEEQFGT